MYRLLNGIHWDKPRVMFMYNIIVRDQNRHFTNLNPNI